MPRETTQIVALLLTGLLIPTLSDCRDNSQQLRSSFKTRLISLFSSRPLQGRHLMNEIMSSLVETDVESTNTNVPSVMEENLNKINLVNCSHPVPVTINQGFECISLNLGNAMKQASMRERVREGTLYSIDALEKINRWLPTLEADDPARQHEIIEILKESLRCYETRYRKREHPHVGAALHNLSVAYVLLYEEYDKALPLCNEGLRIRKETLGEYHVDIIISLAFSGLLYLALENYKASSNAFYEALEICVGNESWSNDDERYAMMGFLYNNIGCTLYKGSMGPDAALESFGKAISIYRNVLKTAKSCQLVEICLLNIATILTNIGFVKLNQKEYNEAMSAFDESLLLLSSVLGEHHGLARITIDNIAFANGFH